MEKGLLTVFEYYFFKSDPESSVCYDTFISLFVKLAKGPCDEKAKFMVALMKQNSNDGTLTISNATEVSVFLHYNEILHADVEAHLPCGQGLFGAHDYPWLYSKHSYFIGC
jgi:hypothetical protein